ncbi:hypothetical protein K8R30_03865 [archaeon]|nr:hypothetical protein [archaeon]
MGIGSCGGTGFGGYDFEKEGLGVYGEGAGCGRPIGEIGEGWPLVKERGDRYNELVRIMGSEPRELYFIVYEHMDGESTSGRVSYVEKLTGRVSGFRRHSGISFDDFVEGVFD